MSDELTLADLRKAKELLRSKLGLPSPAEADERMEWEKKMLARFKARWPDGAGFTITQRLDGPDEFSEAVKKNQADFVKLNEDVNVQIKDAIEKRLKGDVIPPS